MKETEKQKWFKLITNGVAKVLYALGFLLIAIAKLIDSLNH